MLYSTNITLPTMLWASYNRRNEGIYRSFSASFSCLKSSSSKKKKVTRTVTLSQPVHSRSDEVRPSKSAIQVASEVYITGHSSMYGFSFITFVLRSLFVFIFSIFPVLYKSHLLLSFTGQMIGIHNTTHRAW